MLLYRARVNTARFLARVTPLTWAIWLILIADLLAPGQWRYSYIVAELDLSTLVEEVSLAYGNND